MLIWLTRIVIKFTLYVDITGGWKRNRVCVWDGVAFTRAHVFLILRKSEWWWYAVQQKSQGISKRLHAPLSTTPVSILPLSTPSMSGLLSLYLFLCVYIIYTQIDIHKSICTGISPCLPEWEYLSYPRSDQSSMVSLQTLEEEWFMHDATWLTPTWALSMKPQLVSSLSTDTQPTWRQVLYIQFIFICYLVSW